MTPTPFGFPAWKNCKKRVAKKWINSHGRNMFNRMSEFSKMRVGDLVNTCTGLNHRVEKVEPVYDKIGKKAEVLFDLEFVCTDGHCCSLHHCGVEPAKSKEEIQEYISNLIEYYTNREDSYGFVERYSKIELNEDGTERKVEEKSED